MASLQRSRASSSRALRTLLVGAATTSACQLILLVGAVVPYAFHILLFTGTSSSPRRLRLARNANAAQARHADGENTPLHLLV
eukprot:symbB.v1.2.031750.t1/scaffold3713.1/size51583/4